jgi:Leucine Rich Repeat
MGAVERSLRSLDLSSNRLSEAIPKELGGLFSLGYLDLFTLWRAASKPGMRIFRVR